MKRRKNKNNRPYDSDSLTNIWSSGKSISAILMAMMHDKGLLDYKEKLAKYWPEFAKNGKQDIIISDLMKHQAGLSRLFSEVDLEWTLTENIKKNKIGTLIENNKIFYPFGLKRQYHSITRDWISNEVFRRIEPKGRTLGEYLRQEVSNKLLDKADIHIGVQTKDLDRCFDFTVGSLYHDWINLLLPLNWGRASLHHYCFVIPYTLKFVYKSVMAKYNINNYNSKHIDFQWAGTDEAFHDTTLFRQTENPSVGVYASARGLARMAVVMANGGTFKGKTVLSDSAWKELHADPEVQLEGLMG